MDYDETKRQSYLSFRSSGFTRRESARLAKVTERTIRNWRAADPEFKATDERSMYELYKEQGVENLSHSFMRNLKLLREWDYKLVNKSINNPDEMSKAESKALIDVRGSYTPEKM